MKKLIRGACEAVRRAGLTRVGGVLLAATAVMSSCVTEPTIEIGSGDGKTIVFKEAAANDIVSQTTTSRAMTEHPIENDPDKVDGGVIPNGGSFGVYGWTLDDTNTTILPFAGLQNIPVTHNGNQDYYYNPKAQWPAGEHMNFWAYYPHSNSDYVKNFEAAGGMMNVDASTFPRPTIDFTVPEDGASHIDLMYAYDGRKEGYKQVELTFHHALSRMQFSARIQDFRDGTKVKITGITVKDIFRSGTVRTILMGGEPNPPQPDRGNSTIMVLEDWSLRDKGVVRVNDDHILSDLELTDGPMPVPVIKNTTEHGVSGDLLVLPQYRSTDDLVLEITATENGNPLTYSIPLTGTPNMTRNHIYNYGVTLTPQEATVKVVVTPWGAGGESEYVTDGVHYLKLNKREFVFPCEGGEQDLSIFTDHPDGWTIENVDPDGSWVDPSFGFGAVRSGSPDIEAIRSVFTHPNTSSAWRTATFEVVAGNMHMEVTVRQEPARGILAPPGVLGVGVESGRLTLRGSKEYAGTDVEWQSEFGPLADETVYISYFKWGSLVGMSSNLQNPTFGPDEVVWVPARESGGSTEEALAGYKFALEMSSMGSSEEAWNFISEAQNGTFPENNASAVLGDPCTYADGADGTGLWVTPTLSELESKMYFLADVNVAGTQGCVNNSWNTFMPYAGYRMQSINDAGMHGWYHTKDQSETVWINETMPPMWTPIGYDGVAAAVRCVKKREIIPPKSGILAPPGVLGVGAETGKLTLRGSKEFEDNVNINYIANNYGWGGLAEETVYIAYFKWGSLIGLSSELNDDRFSPDDVVWAPSGYDIAGMMSRISENPFYGNGWNEIPWQDQDMQYYDEANHEWVTPFPANNPAAALGDPCAFADDGNGAFRLPKNGETFGYLRQHVQSPPFVSGVRSASGMMWEVFLPAAGHRLGNPYQMGNNAGKVEEQGTHGIFMSSSSNGNATQGDSNGVYTLMFSMEEAMQGDLQVGVSYIAQWNYANDAVAVRCVPNVVND